MRRKKNGTKKKREKQEKKNRKNAGEENERERGGESKDDNYKAMVWLLERRDGEGEVLETRGEEDKEGGVANGIWGFTPWVITSLSQ